MTEQTDRALIAEARALTRDAEVGSHADRVQALARLADALEARLPGESAQTNDEPTERTSNHGWAIWHLTRAKHATSVAEAQMHAACANARAQLQVSCEMGAQRGVDPNGPTLWQEDWS